MGSIPEYFLWDPFSSIVIVLLNVYIGTKLLCVANNVLIFCVQVFYTLKKRVAYGSSAHPDYVPLDRLGTLEKIVCLTWYTAHNRLDRQRDIKWWLRWNGFFWRYFRITLEVHTETKYTDKVIPMAKVQFFTRPTKSVVVDGVMRDEAVTSVKVEDITFMLPDVEEMCRKKGMPDIHSVVVPFPRDAALDLQRQGVCIVKEHEGYFIVAEPVVDSLQGRTASSSQNAARRREYLEQRPPQYRYERASDLLYQSGINEFSPIPDLAEA